MNDDALYEILKKVFSTYGYHLSMQAQANMLVAERPHDRLLIMHSQNGDYHDVEHLISIIRRRGSKGLVVTTEFFAPDVRRFADQNNILLWGKDELERQIGKAVLANLDRRKYEDTPQGNVSDFFGLGGEQGSYIPQSLLPNALENPAYASIDLHARPVHTQKQKAISIADSHVGQTKNVTLRFIPFWHYRYKVDLEKQYKSRHVDLSGDGAGIINALMGENKFVHYEQEVCDRVSVPDENYTIKEPKISKEEAKRIAIKAITKEHTKQLRINEMVGEVLIFENKSFKPAERDINIKLDLIYIPIWDIEGETGSIEINACDGSILTKIIDSDAEFV